MATITKAPSASLSLDPADWPEDTRERHTYLEQIVRRFDCFVCKSQPRIAWMGMLTGEENYGLKCNCWTCEGKQLPQLAKTVSHVNERRWNMVKTELARRPDALAIITEQDVREHLRVEDVTPGELALFVRFCNEQSLNPFALEAYLIKPQGKPAYTVVDYKVLFKYAHRDPDYKSYKAGIAVLTEDGNFERRTGSISLPGEIIVGGWCKVWLKGLDEPQEEEVSFAEFNTGQAVWKQKPGFMVEKAAITTVFRRAVRGIDDLMRGSGAMRIEAGDVQVAVAVAESAEVEAPTVIDNEPVARQPDDDPTADLYEQPAAKAAPADGDRSFAHMGELLTAIQSEFGVEKAGVEEILSAGDYPTLATIGSLGHVYDIVKAHFGRGPAEAAS